MDARKPPWRPVQWVMVPAAIVVIIAAGAILCGFTPDPFIWSFDLGIVTVLAGLWALPALLARSLVRRPTRLPRIAGWTVVVLLVATVVASAVMTTDYRTLVFRRASADAWRSDLAWLDARLAAVLATLEDGHSLYFPFFPASSLGLVPVQVRFFAEGLFITAAGGEYRALTGRRVARIAGLPVEEAYRRIERLWQPTTTSLAARPPLYMLSPRFWAPSESAPPRRSTSSSWGGLAPSRGRCQPPRTGDARSSSKP